MGELFRVRGNLEYFIIIFTYNLCAKLSKATPHANSPSPELALEIAPPIHPGKTTSNYQGVKYESGFSPRLL
jgi:hypothetical protein